MKSICCHLKMSTLSKVLIFVDILRGMLVSALLVGLFCGMATVYLEKLPEELFANSTKRVDYHRDRELFVGCIVGGISICVVDILMALALDNILNKNLGKASLMWMNCSLLGILLRCGLYSFIWKNEKWLALDRLNKLTPTVQSAARMLFVTAVIYEAVKVVELIVGVASQMELQGKDEMQKKRQTAPKKVKRRKIWDSTR